MRLSIAFPATAALFVSAGALAQAEFDPPLRITAGDDNFSSIPYPSPVLFDIDGDEKRDLVIGDLRGHLAACAPNETGDDLTWSAMKNLQSQGKPLKLHNW